MVSVHVNQSLLIAEIYQHSVTSTTLTWLRPPRPRHGQQCEIVWIYLVFCVLYVNQSLLIAEIYQHSVTSTNMVTNHHDQVRDIWTHYIYNHDLEKHTLKSHTGMSISPSLILSMMSWGGSPSTVHPTDCAVPSICFTVPVRLLEIERECI